MNKRAWIGIAILSASWILGLSYYHAARWMMWTFAIVLGTALLCGAVRVAPRRYVGLAAIVMILPMIAIAPWPYYIIPLLLVLGLALLIAPIPRQWPKRLGSGLFVSGVVLLAQSIAMIGYEAFTARFPDLPLVLSQPLGAIAGLLGIDMAVWGSDMAMFTMREVHHVAATWALLLDPMSWCFIVGGVVLIMLKTLTGEPSAPVARRVAWFIVPIILWLPLRTVLLLSVYLHRALLTGYDDPLNALVNQFWNPWISLILLAGPVLLAWRFVRARQPAEQGSAASNEPFNLRSPRSYLPAAMVLAAVVVFTFAAGWAPVGQRKDGRILVDDYHSLQPWPRKTYDTTRTDKPFDTKSYGPGSAYNHYSLFEYCRRFFTMSRQSTPLTEADLNGCDVLVLKVPSAAYTPDEIELVREFVEGGGGLLLLGEHTSVFGSGVYLNEVAESFDFRFRYDCAFGVDSVFEQEYEPPLMPHPIVQHMSRMDFATSCTIEARATGWAVIRDTGLKSLGANYHVANFYPQAKDRPEMRYGAFVQLLARPYGEGRVAAFTDSTIFSGFCAFEPGKSDLMLGMLGWLNHRGRGSEPRPWLIALGVALLIGAIVLRHKWRADWLLMLAAGALGWALGVPTVRAINLAAMPKPKAARPMVRVGIDRTICDAKLPRNGFIAGRTTDFGQFERSILRLGYYPFRAAGSELTDSSIIVFMNPHLSIPPGFKEKLKKYVASGGKLLVIDSPENNKSTATRLLQVFDRKLKIRPPYVPLSGRLASLPKGWPAPTVKNSLEVEGGTPFARLKGRPVGAWVKYNKGEVWVLGFGSRFTDNQMGFIGDAVPTGDLIPVFEFVFTLFRAIAEEPAPTTAPASRPAPTTRPAR